MHVPGSRAIWYGGLLRDVLSKAAKGAEVNLCMLAVVQHHSEGRRSSIICVREELLDHAQAEGVVSDHIPDPAAEFLSLLEVHSEPRARHVAQMTMSSATLSILAEH